MVRIRLRKVGSKGQPSFRLVAADRESPRDGRFLENLGYYNPRTDPATIQVKEDRVFHWLKQGAQPSDSVLKLFKVTGTLERFERLKGGEDVEALVSEARAAQEARTTTVKTRQDEMIGRASGGKSKKQKAAEAASATGTAT